MKSRVLHISCIIIGLLVFCVIGSTASTSTAEAADRPWIFVGSDYLVEGDYFNVTYEDDYCRGEILSGDEILLYSNEDEGATQYRLSKSEFFYNKMIMFYEWDMDDISDDEIYKTNNGKYLHTVEVAGSVKRIGSKPNQFGYYDDTRTLNEPALECTLEKEGNADILHLSGSVCSEYFCSGQGTPIIVYDSNGRIKMCKIVGASFYSKAENLLANGQLAINIKFMNGIKEGDRIFVRNTEIKWNKSVSGILFANMKAKGKKSLKISWNRVTNADGYDVFFARCDTKEKKTKLKKIKTVKRNSTFTLTKAGLSKGKEYKAQVKAYTITNGKKKYVRTSPVVHAIAGGSNGKYCNPKSITIAKKAITIKKGKTANVKVKKITGTVKSKKLFWKGHEAKVRYKSSNTKIATVTSKGKIKAVSKGKCTVYAYTVNGIRKAITVTVK